jgi:hypothetical protein
MVTPGVVRVGFQIAELARPGYGVSLRDINEIVKSKSSRGSELARRRKKHTNRQEISHDY